MILTIKTGLLPFNLGVALMARGVNTISTLDHEKEERRMKDRLFISSSELTITYMIKYNENWERNKKTTTENQRSLVFSELDPDEVIEKYEELKVFMCLNLLKSKMMQMLSIYQFLHNKNIKYLIRTLS